MSEKFLTETGVSALIGKIKDYHQIFDVAEIFDNSNQYDFNPSEGMPIVFWNKNENKREELSYSECVDIASGSDDFIETHIPIGVVVVPKSHTKIILPGTHPAYNKSIMISLKSMNHNTPDTGGEDDNICWGKYGNDQDLLDLWNYGEYDSAPHIENQEMIEVPSFPTDYTFLPSDLFKDHPDFEEAWESTACPGCWYAYNDEDSECPCPFVVIDGVYKPNPAYYLPWNDDNPSLTSDFNGYLNTSKILKYMKIENWKTRENIPNTPTTGNYPAAACCWRYSTPGTSQGDWYLPSIGELGYIMPFFNKINNTINRINQIYGAGTAVALDSNGGYWSSTECSSDCAYFLDTGSGDLDGDGKGGSYYVRAFAAV